MHPRVRFSIDPSQDIRAYDRFSAERSYDDGRSFRWAVVDRYPRFRRHWRNASLHVPREEILEFIGNRYSSTVTQMGRSVRKYERDWRNVESKFHRSVAKLFPNPVWPSGKYLASLTIWGLCPRFLDDATFLLPAFPRRSTHGNVIIAHEMLHFIFFRYFRRWYPQYRRGRYEMLGWHTSEIFNSVVQNSTTWVRIFRNRSILYPEHRRIVRAVAKRLGKDQLRARELTKIILEEISANGY